MLTGGKGHEILRTMRLSWRICALFALASCAVIRRSPCRDLHKIPRGGADKKHVKKLDPRGTPLAARAARPLVALAERYDAAIEANPKLELWIQIGGTILVLQTIKAYDDSDCPVCSSLADVVTSRVVTRYGDHRYATLLARALYLGFLLAHQVQDTRPFHCNSLRVGHVIRSKGPRGSRE